MLKSVCPHMPVMAVVFAISMFSASQSAAGGLCFFPPCEDPTTPPTVDPVLRDVVATVGNFKAPVRIALSRSSDMYVTDRVKGVVFIYDETGKGIGALQGLTTPAGLAVYDPPAPEPAPDVCDDGKKTKDKHKDKGDPDACPPPPPPQSIVYVGDDSNGSVKVFNNGDVSLLGSGSGEFIAPSGIAVSETQAVYVVDSKAHQVKVYDDFGDLQFTFGSQGSADGQLDFPVDIVLNEILGEVYVSDFWNRRIVVFDLAGNWLRNIITPLNDGGGQAYSRPSGLGIDPDGNLYVVDNALSCVTVITNWGTLIDIIGYSNEQYWFGELVGPLDAAADGQLIYVISGQEHIVKIFNGVAP
jgi:sugar lactone lactonase YvrE